MNTRLIKKMLWNMLVIVGWCIAGATTLVGILALSMVIGTFLFGDTKAAGSIFLFIAAVCGIGYMSYLKAKYDIEEENFKVIHSIKFPWKDKK